MQGVILITFILVGSVFSLPYPKTPVEDDPIMDSNNPVEKPEGYIRTQRNLYQFHSMIDCATTLTSYDYHDYGCFCGYGGGGTPVDDTDRCCQIHDSCYDAIMNDPNLCSYSSAVYWKIYTRDDTCTGCADEEGSCGRAICECDGEAARCFARSQYNPQHFNYPQENCKAKQAANQE